MSCVLITAPRELLSCAIAVCALHVVPNAIHAAAKTTAATSLFTLTPLEFNVPITMVELENDAMSIGARLRCGKYQTPPMAYNRRAVL
jgi:hypothetical protein